MSLTEGQIFDTEASSIQTCKSWIIERVLNAIRVLLHSTDIGVHLTRASSPICSFVYSGIIYRGRLGLNKQPWTFFTASQPWFGGRAQRTASRVWFWGRGDGWWGFELCAEDCVSVVFRGGGLW